MQRVPASTKHNRPTSAHGPLHEQAHKRLFEVVFEYWYAEQVTAQLDGRDAESTDLRPVSLSLPILGAK